MTRTYARAVSLRRPIPSSPPALTQFVVLSLLLHVLVVIVFGSPAGDGSQSGWRNPLSVTLRPRASIAQSLFKPSPGDERGRAGPAFPRAAERAPQAPERASSAPSPAAPPAAEPAPPAAATAPPVDEPALAPPVGLPAEDTLPRIDPGAPIEVDKIVVPQVKIVPLEEKPKPAPPAPSSAPRARRTPAAPATAAPDLPVAAPPPQDLPAARSLETVPPQRVETPTASVLQGEAPPRPEPAAAPAIEPTVVAPPPPVPPVREAPARIEPRPELAPAPTIDRELIPLIDESPSLRTLREAPSFKSERETPAPAPVVPPPPIVPAPPIAPALPVVPAQPARTEGPPLREAPVAPSAPSVETPAPVPARESMRAPAAPGGEPSRPADAAPGREIPAPPSLERLNFGTRPAVDDDLRQLVEPPSAALPGAALPPIGERPRLSFEKPAPRDANRAGGRSPGLVPLNLAPPAPEPETKLGRAIQKAAQPDCREAYAGLGLLAVPLLIADTITDKGCRW